MKDLEKHRVLEKHLNSYDFIWKKGSKTLCITIQRVRDVFNHSWTWQVHFLFWAPVQYLQFLISQFYSTCSKPNFNISNKSSLCHIALFSRGPSLKFCIFFAWILRIASYLIYLLSPFYFANSVILEVNHF